MPPQRGAAAELGAAALLVKRQGAAHRVGGATDDPGHIVLRVQLAGQQDDVAAPPDEGVGVVAIIVVERRPFLGAQEGCTSDSQGRSLPFQASQLSPPGSCNHNLLVGVPTCTTPAALFSCSSRRAGPPAPPGSVPSAPRRPGRRGSGGRRRGATSPPGRPCSAAD